MIGHKEHPLVAITIGDAAGVGPEVALKAALDPGVRAGCRPILVGAKWVLDDVIEKIAPAERDRLVGIKGIGDLDGLDEDAIVVLDTDNVAREEVTIGKLSRAAGVASAEDTETAVRLAMTGAVDAVVSGPVNKQGLQLAGRNYPGQTEFVTALTNGETALKILVGGKLRIAQLSSHMSLSSALGKITRERITKTASRFATALHDAWGIENPRVAVAALNPHAGDNGLLGMEEIDIIRPAVEDASALGHDIVGPVPADVVFMQGEEGRYDGVVSMYHDQGTIPLKRLKFASVAYGLPIVRTTPGHGTAYDIAGSGTVDPTAMITAIELAADLARQRPEPDRPER